jgi:hypothetical protein
MQSMLRTSTTIALVSASILTFDLELLRSNLASRCATTAQVSPGRSIMNVRVERALLVESGKAYDAEACSCLRHPRLSNEKRRITVVFGRSKVSLTNLL